jgi:PhzF family phenazine biosynthesis protein
VTKTAYSYGKIDAFTAGNSLGNPAACLYLGPDQRLSEREMLEIAKRHKGFVSEVVYCAERADGVHLTYYSSECEVDFCGHGTIACMVHWIKRSPALLAQTEIRIETNRKGSLTVYNRIPEQDAVLVAAPAPVFIGSRASVGAIADALGIPSQSIRADLPVDCIDAGLRTLIVPLRDLATEISVFPDEQTLKRFCIENGADIVLIFSMEAERPDHIAHTRVFAPKFGYLEDPATGSGNSAFGYYMLKNKLWDGSDSSLEQGGSDRVYNDVRLSTMNGAVLFGGSATVRIDGVYYV